MKVWIVTALLLTACACHKKEAPAAKPIYYVEVTKAQAKNVTLFNHYVGHVQPYVQVEVQAQVEGMLTGYYFKEGDEVQPGDLIFTIDARPYEAQLSRTKAALSQSIANLRYSEEVVRRNEALAKDDFVSPLQYDQYKTEVLTSKAAIEVNQAEIEAAQVNLSYCTIYSPIRAVTGQLKIQVGNLIQNAGQTLVLLNQITPTYVYFSVPQKDLTRIMQLANNQTLNIESYLGEKVSESGTLDLIDNQINDKTGSIWLRGVFPNEKKTLWPGEFVDVKLFLEEKQNAILLPSEAVTLGQKGKYVYVVQQNKTVEVRIVQTGQRFGGEILIEKGVDADDLVVTQGQINLTNGAKVKIKNSGGQS